ncbi:MAG: PsbP-related protein [Methanobacteriaceae archaeon]|nr:PsbP-related protein [Methanobacteriaceae archaeon]
MKKYFLALLVLSLVVFTSGCTSNTDTKDNQTKTLSPNNVSFTYPGTWAIADSQANDTIAAVADPSSVNAQTGLAQTVVTVQLKKLTGTFDSMYADNYESLFSNSSYQRVSEGNLTLNGRNVLEYVYTIDADGTNIKQRAIWIQDNKNVYVILCSALTSQFDKEKQNFDMIINSFNIS